MPGLNSVPVAALTKLKAGLDHIIHPEKRGASHAFIVGQTNHWIAVIANQSKGLELTRSEAENLSTTFFQETILIDSRNSFVLGKSEEDILKIVAHRGRSIVGSFV